MVLGCSILVTPFSCPAATSGGMGAVCAGGCSAADTNKNTLVFTAWGKLGRPMVLGHRGGVFTAPENTVEAVRAARDAGADGVEVDVMMTKDGAVVMFYDMDTARLCRGEAVRKARPAPLCRRWHLPLDWFNCGIGKHVRGARQDDNQVIPLLEDVLKEFSLHKVVWAATTHVGCAYNSACPGAMGFQ
eukprot:gene2664-3339_t